VVPHRVVRRKTAARKRAAGKDQQPGGNHRGPKAATAALEKGSAGEFDRAAEKRPQRRDRREETAEKRTTLPAEWPSDDGVSERITASLVPNWDGDSLTAGFNWRGC